jgi:hypothetical protein
MFHTLMICTVISEMHLHHGVSGLLVLFAFLQLQLALGQMDGWDHPSLTGSNMGLRILKRDEQRKSIYIDRNRKGNPKLPQSLNRINPTMNMVSNQNIKFA